MFGQPYIINKFKSQGETAEAFEQLGSAEAGVRIEFSNEFTGVFAARGCLEPELQNKLAALAAFRRKREQLPGEADEDAFAIVTGVVRAESATVLVSNSANAVVELRAEGSLPSPDLGALSAGMSVAGNRNMSITQVAAGDVTPLYQPETVEQEEDGGLGFPVFSSATLMTGRTPEEVDRLGNAMADEQSIEEPTFRPVRPSELGVATEE